jgi:hypothetical protein
MLFFFLIRGIGSEAEQSGVETAEMKGELFHQRDI